jgi:hypothetical protein
MSGGVGGNQQELGPVARALLNAFQDQTYGAGRFADVRSRCAEPPSWWLDLTAGERLILEDRTQQIHPQLHPVVVRSIGEPHAELITPTGKQFTISWSDYHYRLFAYDSKAWSVLEDIGRKVRTLKKQARALKRDRRALFQGEIERVEAEGKRQWRSGIYPSWTIASEGQRVICAMGKPPFEHYLRGVVVGLYYVSRSWIRDRSWIRELHAASGNDTQRQPFLVRNDSIVLYQPRLWKTMLSIGEQIDVAETGIIDISGQEREIVTELRELFD